APTIGACARPTIANARCRPRWNVGSVPVAPTRLSIVVSTVSAAAITRYAACTAGDFGRAVSATWGLEVLAADLGSDQNRANAEDGRDGREADRLGSLPWTSDVEYRHGALGGFTVDHAVPPERDPVGPEIDDISS